MHLVTKAPEPRFQLRFHDDRFMAVVPAAPAVGLGHLRAEQPRLSGLSPGRLIDHPLRVPAGGFRDEFLLEELLRGVLQDAQLVIHPGGFVLHSGLLVVVRGP